MTLVGWFTSWLLPAAAAPIDDLLVDPAGAVLADPATPAGFRMVALGHLAEAVVGQVRDGVRSEADGIAAVDRLAAAASDPRLSPWGVPVADVVDLGDHGLLLTHLAIVFGARDALHPEACDAALHERIVRHLAERSLVDPGGVGRSFASSAARWPADQAATLYALHLHDRAHGTAWVDAPRDRLLSWLLVDGVLPPTERTGTAPDPEIPRGSALSFTARYLAPVAPDTARTLWRRMQDDFVVRLASFGVAGVREWPPGVVRAPDIDSGPIVLGIGASATAFGLCAARALGDDELADALTGAARLGDGVARVDDGAGAAANSALARAIRAVCEVRRPLGAAPR